jgi:DNA-directed RNA polymerase specialized sigma24 family protein
MKKLLALLPFVGRLRRPVPEAHRAGAEAPQPTAVGAPPEKAERMARLLATMPREQREALRLHYWHRWPLAAIARRLRLTSLQAAGLIWRGTRALEREFPPAGAHPTGARRCRITGSADRVCSTSTIGGHGPGTC